MRTCVVALGVLLGLAAPAWAQAAGGSSQGRDMPAMSMSSPWMVMTDGAVFGTINHQGGPRGADEFRSTNWLMVMARRPLGRGQFTATGMFSLDPATATPRGYAELFQSGEAYHGQPIVDRQHPHDLLMGATLEWRLPVGRFSSFAISGGPVGEPALGPIAFMHRPAAAENSAAPLSHHTLDSTHISMGVVTAGFDAARWAVEGSVFNGREPDDNRWDLMDPGPLDSWSARAWFTPTRDWRFQVSRGHLTDPEELEPGNIDRTTASGTWFRTGPRGFSAVTAAVGQNSTIHGDYRAVLVEATEERRPRAYYTRVEVLQTELTERAWLTAVTLGATHDIPRWGRWEPAIGADVTLYRVPDGLRASYGDHPVSFHVFLRVRTPQGRMGRMWNMRN
jgi:hypothetical protein